MTNRVAPVLMFRNTATAEFRGFAGRLVTERIAKGTRRPRVTRNGNCHEPYAVSQDEGIWLPNGSPSVGLHANRVAGGHCYHCHPGGDAPAGLGTRATQGHRRRLPGKPEATRGGMVDVYG